MRNSTINIILMIAMVFVAFVTLGGLGNAAVKEPFYWFPFVANVLVYGWIIYRLYKARNGEE